MAGIFLPRGPFSANVTEKRRAGQMFHNQKAAR
jgi:hypothetical protein